jgi:transcriptional regulator with XRE-family HTH domain
MADEDYIERRHFLAALQAKEREVGRGFQKQLAGDTGYSDSYINQIIRGNRGLSFKAQSRIVKALKYKYADFLEMGKNILDGITGQGDMKAATIETVNCPPNADPLMLGKAGIVLASGTIYGRALRENIEAFYHAVQRDIKTETTPLKIESGTR